jgi:NAD(P)-dependent dehydrogenase (short-subunit alcohol dehydrogenase family)
MERQKAKHAYKDHSMDRKCLLTGVSDNNIGSSIYAELKIHDFEVDNYDANDYDLTSGSQISMMLNSNTEIDTLILCHGDTSLDWIENQDSGMIDHLVNVNLTSHIKLVSEFAEMTIDRHYRKTIIVIGSMAASAVLNGSAPYCAAKAGLQHFVKCAAWELAPKGFDVYLVNPSNVLSSPMTDKTITDLARYRDISLDDAASYWASSNPRDQFLSKSEIARLVVDLANGKYPYLSGTPLNLGGGQR